MKNKNTIQNFLGPVQKSRTGQVVGSKAYYESLVERENSFKKTNVEVKPQLTDDELEKKAIDKLSCDSNFMNDLYERWCK